MIVDRLAFSVVHRVLIWAQTFCRPFLGQDTNMRTTHRGAWIFGLTLKAISHLDLKIQGHRVHKKIFHEFPTFLG